MLRLLVTARWIGWTLCALIAVAVCGAMAWWQLGRAESPTGSLLNAGYAFQWPLFGLFFAALWWRMLRAEARALDEVRDEPGADEPGSDEHGSDEHGVDEPGILVRDPSPARVRTRQPTPVRAAPDDSPFGPRPAGAVARDADDAPSPERARWNAMYAELAARDAAREAARNTGHAGRRHARPVPTEETDPS